MLLVTNTIYVYVSESQPLMSCAITQFYDHSQSHIVDIEIIFFLSRVDVKTPLKLYFPVWDAVRKYSSENKSPRCQMGGQF